VRGARVAVLAAVLGGIVAVVAGALLIESFTVGALVAALAGVLCLSGGSVLARRFYARIRYRISRPFSGLLLVTKIAAGLAVFVALVVIARTVDFPALPRRAMVAVLVGGLGWLIADHVTRTTLFLADATGVRFGRTPVPWPAIAQLVVSPGAHPGTAEIGATRMPGAPPAPVAVVPAATVRWDRLSWMIAQSGRPDIQLIGQLPAPGPAPRRPLGWAIGGIGGSVLLVVGVVLAVTLNDSNDSPAESSGADAKAVLKYGSGGSSVCGMLDLSVVKKWSTIQEIVQESTRTINGPNAAWLNCHAYNNSALAEGNTAAMDLTIDIKPADAAAKTVYDKENDGFVCGADRSVGDAEDRGAVAGLGERARYGASSRDTVGNIQNDYILRMQDANLMFCLHVYTYAQKGAPFVIGKAELGEYAARQAKSVLGKLIVEQKPASKTGSYRDRVSAQRQEHLTYLDEQRKLDPCGFLSESAVSKLGAPAYFGTGRSLNTCEVRFWPVTEPNEIREIELTMGAGTLSGNGGAHDVKVGDRTARMGLEGPLCTARIDFDDKQGIDFKVDSASRSANVCPALLDIMSASVPLFKNRPALADSRHAAPSRLARMDPCEVLNVVGKGRDTIEVDEAQNPWTCGYFLAKPTGRETPRQGIDFQFATLNSVTGGFSGNPIKVSGVPAGESGNDRDCKIVLGVGADHPFNVINGSGEQEQWIDTIEVIGNTGCEELRKTAVELVRLYKEAK